MNRPIPVHGTNARYKGRQDLPPCRCPSCTRAASRADAERRLARLSGKPRTAPADLFEQVIRHLQHLVANDMSQAQIGHSAGVSQTTVAHLLSGRRKSLKASTAEKILAARVDDRTGTCMVSAVGTMRRLQALYWMGHRMVRIEAETGFHHDSLLWIAQGSSARTTAARVEMIRMVYDRLSMTDGGSQAARDFALKNGWHGPLAWDDETIDDPAAVPLTDALEPVATEGGNIAARWLMGEAVILGREDRREVLQHLFEWTNDSVEEIAARLDMTPDAAERQWHRIKKQAQLEGRRVWRRAYMPRERTLTQNEMEEAA